MNGGFLESFCSAITASDGILWSKPDVGTGEDEEDGEN